MRIMFLSLTEMEAVSRFWDLYVRQNSEPAGMDEIKLKALMNSALELLSETTRDEFLTAFDAFELQGEEFKVRIAPDDRAFVRM
ncbi:hypothetical protein HYZ64_02960 [Candidatus Berkelbacteria bacterium]|nr:hypothetical protein [Candidatus Berkelbacteria bacterium]